jgi:hypothetical protein
VASCCEYSYASLHFTDAGNFNVIIVNFSSQSLFHGFSCIISDRYEND